jgi:hypothetical protein
MAVNPGGCSVIPLLGFRTSGGSCVCLNYCCGRDDPA